MITVIGVDGSPLPPQAASALAAATLVVGGRRQLAAVAAAPGTAATTAAPGTAATTAAPGTAATTGAPGTAATGPPEDRQAVPTAVPAMARRVELGELAPALDTLAAHDGDAVVLASGDPGFFGIVRALRSRGLAFRVLPAVSSVALAFARAGLPWDDAVVVSAHGRDPRPALNVCRAHPKVAVLTGPGAGPAEIGMALDGWPRRLIVCEHLGSPAERITECPAAEAATRPWQDPNVVLVLADPPATTQTVTSPSVIMSLVWSQQQQCHDHERSAATTEASVPAGAGLNWVWPPAVAPSGGWALAEEAFDSQHAVITKAEVRALALARLAPAPGTLIWDVGAGTGSVAVECARFGAAVIAIERNEERCKLIHENAARHGVAVRVVNGQAPDALEGLPAPDAVFVGGGGAGVVAAAARTRPAKIVTALAAIERAGQAHAALSAAGYTVAGSLVQAARLAPLPGDAHRLAGTNPIFLLWAASAAPAHGAAP
jgi:precorrin-6B C5,15-methyltransferase / cobalt-precorrin-6B C5,C15-methyltransferase